MLFDPRAETVRDAYELGGGSSTPASARVYESRKAAERAIARWFPGCVPVEVDLPMDAASPARGARPVGVVAATQARAAAIVRELGLSDARPIGRRGSARGFALDALVLDESVLPLTEREYDELLPCLLPNGPERLYELRRHTGPPTF